MPYVD